MCREERLCVQRRTVLGKFNSGTKIEKACKALVRRDRILPSGAKKDVI